MMAGKEGKALIKKLIATSVLGVMLLPVASASADVVGDDLAVAPTFSGGTGPVMFAMGPESAGAAYRFPSAGTVTAFRVRTFNPGGSAPSVSFKTLRPTGTANQYTVLAATAPQIAPIAPPQVTTVAGLSLSVQAGDTFGVAALSGDADFAVADDPTTTLGIYTGNPLVGQNASFTPNGSARISVQAEYTPSPAPLPDKTPPTVSFAGITSGAKLKSLKSLGGPVASDATKVEAAVQQTAAGSSAKSSSVAKKKRAKKCRNLSSTSGKLSKRGSCSAGALKYLAASVKSGYWSLTLSKGLPAGSYKAFVRATDAAGNVGTAQVSFKIRKKK